MMTAISLGSVQAAVMTAFSLDSLVQWGPLVLGLVFAVVGTSLFKLKTPMAFTTLLLQSVVFLAALILAISLFYPPLFIVVQHNDVYLGVIAMMTLIYSARDIVGFLGHSKSTTGHFENRT